ncbi:hypothetical protein KFK09_013856 [Dendrobium nobile]|uniref:Demeter RRM-fold domain-containing protein n=1 Tax=Dendrobium nobile TaxID=94219 RepID=A0A8T3BA83_DENNO|nr:hypothetical protein KFK09_013856 [Dendrobium nobile]
MSVRRSLNFDLDEPQTVDKFPFLLTMFMQNLAKYGTGPARIAIWQALVSKKQSILWSTRSYSGEFIIRNCSTISEVQQVNLRMSTKNTTDFAINHSKPKCRASDNNVNSNETKAAQQNEDHEAQNALSHIGNGGVMVPYQGTFELAKRRRVLVLRLIGPEQNRVWKLLMGIEGEGNDGTNVDKENMVGRRKESFSGRVVHLLPACILSKILATFEYQDGKGSVVDSVIGVFLTQNVSDHLSSSAFKALAAKFLFDLEATLGFQCRKVQGLHFQLLRIKHSNSSYTIASEHGMAPESAELYAKNMELQTADMQMLSCFDPEAASIPMPKLKNITRLRTEHHVYEIPDSHPLLKDIRESEAHKVRGTLLYTLSNCNEGSFPLNGTYFQVNEVFADHHTSVTQLTFKRLDMEPTRRTVCFGTSLPTNIQRAHNRRNTAVLLERFCLCRGFDRVTRAPKPLYARLHFPASKALKIARKVSGGGRRQRRQQRRRQMNRQRYLRPNWDPSIIKNGSLPTNCCVHGKASNLKKTWRLSQNWSYGGGRMEAMNFDL